ncbi:MAG TPA: LD-carboxypeptidase [Bacteroidia bacterium]|jgi:muramoyltetrapeptide carboxypeptidase|nr:LD-carboxypeptidase [Bacteroidia bacterium]
MQTITPPFLKRGDVIGLVAPARKISPEELEPALQMLRSWGLGIRIGKNMFGSDNQFSGTDEQRTADFQDLLDDQEVKAVLSVRGGYGTLRIIDRLDFSRFKRSPKWIIGYSDVTVLHSHIHNLGIETLHATMPSKFAGSPASVESLRMALFGEKLKHTWQGEIFGRQGAVEAPLVGGNLSLLYALQGSRSDLNTKGKILFLEDLDEYLYHIDRMILSLKRSGKLDHLAGLVIGGMTEMKDNTIPFGNSAEEIILEAVKEYDYPVAFSLPAGHTDLNLALMMGRNVKLEAGPLNSLEF